GHGRIAQQHCPAKAGRAVEELRPQAIAVVVAFEIGNAIGLGGEAPDNEDHRMPTRPRTDSMSLGESNPMPSLKTSSTFSMSLMFLDGSPFTTTMSACLPASRVPMRADS